jgi:hypothetical protein
MRIRFLSTLDPGSEMKKNRIRDKHPGSATQLLFLLLPAISFRIQISFVLAICQLLLFFPLFVIFLFKILTGISR